MAIAGVGAEVLGIVCVWVFAEGGDEVVAVELEDGQVGAWVVVAGWVCAAYLCEEGGGEEGDIPVRCGSHYVCRAF